MLFANVGFAVKPACCLIPSLKPVPRIWASAEYLYWWEKDGPLDAPLVTTSPNGTMSANAGVIGQPSTQILYGAGAGNDTINFNGFNGGRLTLGGWIDNNFRFGAEGSIFELETKTSSFNASSANNPILAIPFFDVSSKAESAFLISFPGIDTGSIAINNSTSLWGADANGMLGLYTDRNFQLAALAGFRYFNLNEKLNLNTSVFPVRGFVPGTTIDTSDSFKSLNQFYGFQLGARGSLIYQCFTVDLITKVAFGNNDQTLRINGQTVDSVPGASPTTQTGGIFALDSNIGNFHRTQFAVATEEQVKLGYLITPNIHPFISYNFLYINKVLRPGKTIDHNLNSTELPPPSPIGPEAPLPVFNTASFWAQGISAGLEIRF